ncbi:MAG: hypothetical protein JO235_22215 [Chroococcidiopsidaceae cyanobacterium CP_BM_RX_35]|nr:hypothetical protein [Chroococcidiopsidaceae cyanobacterium CP_BM_RX_35]
MLFPMLMIVALLISAFSLATVIAVLGGTTREATQPLIFPTGQFSFWSLVLFLFCPTLGSTSESRYLTSTNHPHQS